MLLVDHALPSNLDALYKLVAADELPSLAQMQQTPQYDLQQAEWLLTEGLIGWGRRADVDLLKAGQPVQTLTPLWKSASRRLFARYNTVLFDDWQPAWTPYLVETTVLYLGAVPPQTPQPAEKAHQLGWLQVETPHYEQETPTLYQEDRVFWPKVGRIPWVQPPVRKQVAYQQSIQAMLERLG